MATAGIGTSPIKVLVVDDSAFMRIAITKMIQSDPGLTVIGTAVDGLDALDKIRLLQPDLVTLDIEMPKLDGLAALRRIMAETPLPVIMVSALTAEGARATFDALDHGAVDYVPKHLSSKSVEMVTLKDQLVQKIKAAVSSHRFKARHAGSAPGSPGRLPSTRGPAPVTCIRPAHPISIVAIGSSTGGPRALQEILSALNADFPVGIVVVQHMPAAFTGPFAKRLDGLCKIEVKEAEEGDEVTPGRALVAPGGHHMVLTRRAITRFNVKLTDEPANLIHRPAVDVTMASVANQFGKNTLGVILTGMGSDGMQGISVIKQKGGYSIAQDEETSVVWGMPKAIVDNNLADMIVPLDGIAAAISGFFSKT